MTSRKILLVAYSLLILCTMVWQFNCQGRGINQNYISFYNCIEQREPLLLRVMIQNSTHKVFHRDYNILYTLEQEQIETIVNLPVSRSIQNYTVITQIYKQSNDKPICSSIRNLTRYSSIRRTDLGMMMEVGDIKQNDHEDTGHGLHLPHNFVIMPLFTNQIIPNNLKQYNHLFNFTYYKSSSKRRFYAPSVDLSQLHVPFKGYQSLEAYVTQQAEDRLRHKKQIRHSNHEQLNLNQTEQLTRFLQEQYIYNMTLTIRVYPFMYFQAFYGFTNLELLRKNVPIETMKNLYTEELIDMIKELFFENNFYILLFYVILSFSQIFMQIFAFKSQIEVWKKIESKGGLSIKMLYQELFFSVVVILYLLNKEANIMYILMYSVGILITLWKITKAFKIGMKPTFPFVILEYKEWYQAKTQSADKEGAKVTVYLMQVFFFLYVVYKCGKRIMKLPYVRQGGSELNGIVEAVVHSVSHLTLYGIYELTLEMLMGFIIVFGFVMIIPQLQINYKLKSVDHLPWKTLIYRFISTIIDDIFVFMVSLPWEQRALSFRDDVGFIIYMVQRRLYNVDKSRIALAGGSVDLKTLKAQDKQMLSKALNPTIDSHKKEQ